MLFLQNFKFPFNLIPSFVHLGGDHCEITAVFFHQFDQHLDLLFGPVSNVGFGFVDYFMFLFGEFIEECDLVDNGGESGDGLSAGILMAVEGVNSHAEDITDRI